MTTHLKQFRPRVWILYLRNADGSLRATWDFDNLIEASAYQTRLERHIAYGKFLNR